MAAQKHAEQSGSGMTRAANQTGRQTVTNRHQTPETVLSRTLMALPSISTVPKDSGIVVKINSASVYRWQYFGHGTVSLIRPVFAEQRRC